MYKLTSFGANIFISRVVTCNITLHQQNADADTHFEVYPNFLYSVWPSQGFPDREIRVDLDI